MMGEMIKMIIVAPITSLIIVWRLLIREVCISLVSLTLYKEM